MDLRIIDFKVLCCRLYDRYFLRPFFIKIPPHGFHNFNAGPTHALSTANDLESFCLLSLLNRLNFLENKNLHDGFSGNFLF